MAEAALQAPPLQPTDGSLSPWARTGEPLLWLAGAGHEFRDAKYGFNARLRADVPHVTLQLTLSGEGFYESRKRERTILPAGSAFLDNIPGPFFYGHAGDSRSVYELVFVSLSGPVAMRWSKRLINAFGNVLHFAQPATPAPLMLELVRRYLDGDLGDRYMTSARLYALLMTVFSSLSTSRVATEPRISRAISLITQRATDPSFDVTTLAAQLDCSREYLARRFIAATGVSPSDYLSQHRLRLAAGALRSGDDKLEAVARKSGFSNANYLCRVFRQHVGVTPTVFRQRPWMAMP